MENKPKKTPGTALGFEKNQEKEERKEAAFEKGLEVAATRGHELSDFDYENSRTATMTVFCKKHNKTQRFVRYRSYVSPHVKWGVKCCAGEEIGKDQKNEQTVLNKLRDIASKRNHEISDFQYDGVNNCTFTVACPRHDMAYTGINYQNYTHARVKWGIPCCARYVELDKADRQYQEVFDLAKRRNHTISDWVYNAKKDCFFSVTCSAHKTKFVDVKYGIYTFPGDRGNLPCCIFDVQLQNESDWKKLVIQPPWGLTQREKISKYQISEVIKKENPENGTCLTLFCVKNVQTEDLKKRQGAFDRVETLAKGRNHQISDFVYEGSNNRFCTFTVTCLKHNRKYENIRYRNYTRPNSKSGSVPCCKKKEAKTFRTPFGKLVQWQKSLCSQANVQVLTCQVTGLSKKTSPEVVVVCHHLYSSAGAFNISNVPQNGVMLLESIHKRFHREHSSPKGTTLITPTNFVLFLEKFLQTQESLELLIKDLKQDFNEGDKNKGSDTKLNCMPVGVLKAHEVREKIIILIKQIKEIIPILEGYLVNPALIPPDELP